jgi:hypothetical protein
MRLRLQLTGGDDVAADLINRLAALAGVERVEETGDLMPHMDDDDSSSAGLPDDEGPGVHQIDVVAASNALDAIRATATAMARERDVAIEFDDPM